jgi:hypothetical protein
MSAPGQTETSGGIRTASGLRPATDMKRPPRHVGFVPQPEIALSLYCRLSILPSVARAIDFDFVE